MMNLDLFLIQAGEALGANSPDLMRAFIETWVPIVTNTVQSLVNEKAFLELQLTEAQSALEDG